MSNYTHGDKLTYIGEDKAFFKKGDSVFFVQDSMRKDGEYCFIQAVGKNAGLQVLVSDLAVEKEEVNPRYASFVRAHGKRANCDYMAFISFMVRKYAESRGEPSGVLDRPSIVDHDQFTEFVELNAAAWMASV